MSRRQSHAVIVAYNAPAALDRCLAGLAGAIPATVIDNSSSAEVARIAENHRARYVDPGANRGFAAGVNAALRLPWTANADVLLLNPDAVITPAGVELLERELHASGAKRIGALAPALRDADGGAERVAWPFPSPWRMWIEAFGLGRLPAARKFVIGAVVLLRREALDAVGEFDERFFLYAEEADWQRRASKLGWRSAVCVEGVAEHSGAGSSSDERRRELLFHAAQETYVRKWYGSGGWLVYRTGACAGAAVRAIALRDARRKQAARRALLYLRGPRRVAARDC